MNIVIIFFLCVSVVYSSKSSGYSNEWHNTGVSNTDTLIDKSPDLVDLGLVNSKGIKQSETTPKTLADWIQNMIGSTTAPSVPENCPKCSCGTTNNPNRIVGGHDAKTIYPWMTYFTYRRKVYCAGSIINSEFVLTVGHCAYRFDPTQIRIHVVGENNRNSSNITEYKVDHVLVHPRYSLADYNNDIALIKIKGKFNIEGPMNPVCLPERRSPFSGKNGTVIGWGAREQSGGLADTLQEVVVPILSNNECRKSKYPENRITDNMMCAGYSEGGKDSCQGDSGGPLLIIENGRHKVAGLVSWGEGCALEGYPGVYTRVNRYITWILSNTRTACYCD